MTNKQVKCGTCMCDLHTEYLHDGKAKRIYCPRCSKELYHIDNWKWEEWHERNKEVRDDK